MASKHQNLQYSILGLGNPLLDISANVPNDLLQKYNIKPNDAILAQESHMPLYEELIAKYNPDYIAGGATQNSIRVAQWMLCKYIANATTFIGCVGSDGNGQKLKECAEKDGVRTHYLVRDDTPTGVCAVCITNTERSLVANLSAANKFHISHLQNTQSQGIIDSAQYFYSSGFHLTVSPESVMHLAKHANEHGKQFLVNLAAPFIVQFFTDPLLKAVNCADFVFGNELEAAELGKVLHWGDDLQKIALQLAKYSTEDGERKRVVVITQGSEPTIVAHDGTVSLYKVDKVASDQVIDTNGAGDAFVGGFLSRLALQCSIADCVSAGHWAASVVIRRSGCTFPDTCDFTD